MRFVHGSPRKINEYLYLANHFRRVEYDVAAAAQAVRCRGLPEHFADLLETGGLEWERTGLPWLAFTRESGSEKYPKNLG